VFGARQGPRAADHLHLDELVAGRPSPDRPVHADVDITLADRVVGANDTQKTVPCLPLGCTESSADCCYGAKMSAAVHEANSAWNL
jgi:hypothetical protein